MSGHPAESDYAPDPRRIDYSDPRCRCRASGMGRRTDCPLHGEKALRRALGHPCQCRQCGGTFDITEVEVTARYADCDMFKAPCCGATCDTRTRWGGPSWARMGYDDLRAYAREEGQPYPLNGWRA